MTASHTEPRTVGQRLAALVHATTEALVIPSQRSALRRALGLPPTDPRCWQAHRFVAPFVVESDDEAAQRALYAVASLIAAQSRTARDEALTGADRAGAQTGEAAANTRHNFGQSLARAVHSRLLRDEAAESRLHLLCRQDLHGLHRQLPRLVLQLRNQGAPVDWVQLGKDLARWERDRDDVARTWLQGYHRTRNQLEAQAKADAKAKSQESENK